MSEDLCTTNPNYDIACVVCGQKPTVDIVDASGRIGSFEGLSDTFPQFHPTPFSKSLRATREGRKVSLRELAMHIGVSVCRLSEIERGFGDAPTAKEEKKIREWMEANDD